MTFERQRRPRGRSGLPVGRGKTRVNKTDRACACAVRDDIPLLVDAINLQAGGEEGEEEEEEEREEEREARRRGRAISCPRFQTLAGVRNGGVDLSI